MMSQELLILLCIGFSAGFIDSIVGGGGLISMPSLFIFFPNLSLLQIVGTNRVASFFGTSLAAYQYLKKVKIPLKIALYGGITTALFSYLAVVLASRVSSDEAKIIVWICMIGVAIYSFFKRDMGERENIKYNESKTLILSVLIGGVMGFYNGFIGPGTGILLVFGFVSLIGFGFLKASALSKVINVIADGSSLVFLFSNNYIQLSMVFPLLMGNLLGSFVGSKLAILRGNKFVKTIFYTVISIVIVRFSYDMLKELLK